MKLNRWVSRICRPGLCGFGIASVFASCLAAGADWEAIECVPADLPAEAMFDVVRSLDDIESTALNWRPELGEQQARALLQRDSAERHGGAASLRVDYEFVGKKDFEYLQIDSPIDFPEPGAHFGFWMKHDGTQFAVRLRIFDVSGECHQIDFRSQTKPGWQFVAGSIDSTSSSWGGDGNHRKDYPCKLVGICIDRPNPGFKSKGSLWLDDVALLASRQFVNSLKVETFPRRFGNVYETGDAVALRASGDGDSIRWSVKDFWGNYIASGSGSPAHIESLFTLSKPGYFLTQIELLIAGQPIETKEFRCAALPRGEKVSPSDFVGVCTHFGQKNYPLDCMDLMQRYGIDQYRDEISWGSYESKKGAYVMPAHAAEFLKRGKELKLRPLLIFDYSNPHYDQGGFPNSPEAIAAFAAYAVDLAKNTRGIVSMFEIWNEWVGGCGMEGRPGQHDGEAYGRLLKPAYAAVKQTFPELTLVGIGGEYGAKCEENILGSIRTAGPNAMDAWSIHPYRYPRSPEESDLVGEVNRLAESVAKAGATSKPWVTEIGYPTHLTSGGSDESAQAARCVRTLALLQSTKKVEKVFWYDFKDDGSKRDYNEDNFGLIRHQRFNCAPKPAIVAMSVFIRKTEGARFVEMRRVGKAFIACYRRGDGSDTWIAWTESRYQGISISGALKSAWSNMGENISPNAKIELSEYPVYLSGMGLNLESP